GAVDGRHRLQRDGVQLADVDETRARDADDQRGGGGVEGAVAGDLADAAEGGQRHEDTGDARGVAAVVADEARGVAQRDVAAAAGRHRGEGDRAAAGLGEADVAAAGRQAGHGNGRRPRVVE